MPCAQSRRPHTFAPSASQDDETTDAEVVASLREKALVVVGTGMLQEDHMKALTQVHAAVEREQARLPPSRPCLLRTRYAPCCGKRHPPRLTLSLSLSLSPSLSLYIYVYTYGS